MGPAALSGVQGSLPGRSILSEGTRNMSGVSQKKRLERVLQVEGAAAAEARRGEGTWLFQEQRGWEGTRRERPSDRGLAPDLQFLY